MNDLARGAVDRFSHRPNENRLENNLKSHVAGNGAP